MYYYGSHSSGTEIQGLVLSSTVNMNTNHPDNLRFIRNHFTTSVSIVVQQGSVTYSGYLFEGNLFDNAQISATAASTYQNFLFQNNYFFENGCCVGGNANNFFNSINVLFNHNLWFGPASGTRDAFAANCRFLSITNNIFVRRNAANQNSSSTFNNNITFNAGNNTPWASNGNVDGGGNVSTWIPKWLTRPQLTQAPIMR